MMHSQANVELQAYRRKALRYHPDKTGHDPAAAEQFQLVQRAYEVLSDDKKRAIFDKYGERGILMMEQMGEVAPFIDPDIILAMYVASLLDYHVDSCQRKALHTGTNSSSLAPSSRPF